MWRGGVPWRAQAEAGVLLACCCWRARRGPARGSTAPSRSSPRCACRCYHAACEKVYVALGASGPAPALAGVQVPTGLDHSAAVLATSAGIRVLLATGHPVLVKPVATDACTRVVAVPKYDFAVRHLPFAREVAACLGAGCELQTVRGHHVLVNVEAAAHLLLVASQQLASQQAAELLRELEARGHLPAGDTAGDGAADAADADDADEANEGTGAGKAKCPPMLPPRIPDEEQRAALWRLVALDIHDHLHNTCRDGRMEAPYPRGAAEVGQARTDAVTDVDVKVFFQSVVSGLRTSGRRNQAASTAHQVCLHAVGSTTLSYVDCCSPPMITAITLLARCHSSDETFARILKGYEVAEDPREARDHVNTVASVPMQQADDLGPNWSMVEPGQAVAICDDVDAQMWSSTRNSMRNGLIGPSAATAPARLTYPRQPRMPPVPERNVEARVADRLPVQAPNDPTVDAEPRFVLPEHTEAADAAVRSLVEDLELWSLHQLTKAVVNDTEGAAGRAGTMLAVSDTGAFGCNWKVAGRVNPRKPDRFVSLLATEESSASMKGNIQCLDAHDRLRAKMEQDTMIFMADLGHLGHLGKYVWGSSYLSRHFMLKPVKLHQQMKAQEILYKMVRHSDLFDLILRSGLLKPGQVEKLKKGKLCQLGRVMWSAVYHLLRGKVIERYLAEQPAAKAAYAKCQELLAGASHPPSMATADAACGNAVATKDGAAAHLATFLAGFRTWCTEARADNAALDVWLEILRAIALAKSMRLNTRADRVKPGDPGDVGSVFVQMRLPRTSWRCAWSTTPPTTFGILELTRTSCCSPTRHTRSAGPGS